MFIHLTEENNIESPNLTQLFNRCAEESITDEQVKRILKPIFERIDAGEFKKLQTPTPITTQNKSVWQRYKFQLASPHSSFDASLEIEWKGAELHIRIEY